MKVCNHPGLHYAMVVDRVDKSILEGAHMHFWVIVLLLPQAWANTGNASNSLMLCKAISSASASTSTARICRLPSKAAPIASIPCTKDLLGLCQAPV